MICCGGRHAVKAVSFTIASINVPSPEMRLTNLIKYWSSICRLPVLDHFSLWQDFPYCYQRNINVMTYFHKPRCHINHLGDLLPQAEVSRHLALRITFDLAFNITYLSSLPKKSYLELFFPCQSFPMLLPELSHHHVYFVFPMLSLQSH